MTEGDHANNRGPYASFWEAKCVEFFQRLLFYGRRLERIANVFEAEELVSETVGRILDRGPDPKTIRTSPLSYLFGVQHHLWADELKKRNRKPMNSMDDPNTRRAVEKQLPVDPRVQQIMETRDALDAMALPGSLPEKEIELFNSLRRGETLEQIAVGRGEHAAVTKVRIHALIAKLHARVKAQAKKSGQSEAPPHLTN